jgi:hypothetical protein
MTAQLLYWPVRGGVARKVVGLGERLLYLCAYCTPAGERHGDVLLDKRDCTYFAYCNNPLRNPFSLEFLKNGGDIRHRR